MRKEGVTKQPSEKQPLLSPPSSLHLKKKEKLGRRERFAKTLLRSSFFVLFWDCWVTLIAIVNCVLFVVGCYTDFPLRLLIRYVAAEFYVMDWIWYFLISKNWVGYIFSLTPVMEVIVVVMMIVNVRSEGFTHGHLDLDFLIIVRLVAFWKHAQYLPYLESIRLVTNRIKYQGVKLLLTIVVLIFIVASVFYATENTFGDTKREWYHCFYFVVVTFSTVGYGDIYATTDLSKLVVIVAICIGVVVIPTQVSALLSLIAQQSEYDVTYKPNAGDHVVVCGNVGFDNIREFLSEFFHEDHEITNTKVVILSTEEPDKDLVALLREPFFSRVVTYVTGSILTEEGVNKARISIADGCFILVDTREIYSSDHQSPDAATVLRALAVRKVSSEIPIFTMLINSKNMHHLMSAGVDSVLSVEELKMGLLGLSCVVPGICCAIANLLLTYSVKYDGTSEMSWDTSGEYIISREQEIYAAPISSRFIGKTFSYAVTSLKSAIGVLLLAVKCNNVIVINPGRNYTFNGSETCYFISDDEHALRRLNDDSFDFQINGNTDEDRELIDLDHEVKEDKQDELDLLKEQSFEESEIDPDRFIELKQIIAKGIQKISRWTVEKTVKNHVLLIGASSGLSYTLKHTKQANMALVLLNSHPPHEKFWENESDLEDVYYVQGSGLSSQDLLRAGLKTASRVIILANKITDQTLPEVVDANVILTYLSIAKQSGLNQDFFYVAELISESNVKFFRYSDRISSVYNTPAFAAGHIFSVTLLDSLICQVYFKSFLVEILRNMINNAGPCYLSSISIPKELSGKTFFELLKHLSSKSYLPIALYRYNKHFPFVFINPPANTILHKKDKALTLVPKTAKEQDL